MDTKKMIICNECYNPRMIVYECNECKKIICNKCAYMNDNNILCNECNIEVVNDENTLKHINYN